MASEAKRTATVRRFRREGGSRGGRSRIRRGRIAPAFADESAGRSRTMSGSEARRPAPATNSTRVASATDLARQGRRANKNEAAAQRPTPNAYMYTRSGSRLSAAARYWQRVRTRQIGRTLESKTMPSHSKPLPSATPQTKNRRRGPLRENQLAERIVRLFRLFGLFDCSSGTWARSGGYAA